MSLWDVVKMNSKEWPQITIGCIGSLIAGGAMPVFAVLFGEIIGVSNLYQPLLIYLVKYAKLLMYNFPFRY